MENQSLEQVAKFGAEEKEEVVLRAIWGKQQGTLILCPVNDRLTGKMRGVKYFTPEEERNQVRVVKEDTTRSVKDGMVLKLTDPIDAVDWQWMKECKEIAMNLEEAQSSPSALFYVEDLDAEVIEKVRLADLKFEAMRLIKESPDFRKSEITKLLGREPQHMRPIEIAEFLSDLADNKPNLIINTYKDKDYKTKLFLMSLLDRKIFYRDPNGFYKYDEINIGVNEAAAIEWLKDDSNAEFVRQFQLMINPPDLRQPSPKQSPEENIVLDDSPEVPQEKEFGGAPVSSYKIETLGGGWYNVVDQDGAVINDKKMRKQAAEEYLGSLE